MSCLVILFYLLDYRIIFFPFGAVDHIIKINSSDRLIRGNDNDIKFVDLPELWRLSYRGSGADAKFGGAELGQIGQNIQFMANALDLGTVVCGQNPPAIDPLEIPENEEGMIVMPLGHMIHPYNFKNRPLWISLLPRIQTSSLSLCTALDQRTEGTSFNGTLTRNEMSQFLWCTYADNLKINYTHMV